MLEGSLRAAPLHGGAAPVEVNADAKLGDDVDLVRKGQEALLGVLLGDVCVAVLNNERRAAPIPAQDVLERTLECVGIRQARGSRVQLHPPDQQATRLVAQVVEVVAEASGKGEGRLASRLVGRGQTEGLILPDVLHRAGDRRDGVEIPMRRQVAGQHVELRCELPGVGNLDTGDPRLVGEELVVVRLEFRCRVRRVGANDEWTCHDDQPSLMISSLPSSGRTYCGPIFF